MCDRHQNKTHSHCEMFLLYFFIDKQLLFIQIQFYYCQLVFYIIQTMEGTSRTFLKLPNFINVAGKCHTYLFIIIGCHSLPASIYLSFLYKCCL